MPPKKKMMMMMDLITYITADYGAVCVSYISLLVCLIRYIYIYYFLNFIYYTRVAKATVVHIEA